jgi:hypothetical protein
MLLIVILIIINIDPISGPARFSQDGALFVYKDTESPNDLHVIDSSSLESLIILEPRVRLHSNTFEGMIPMSTYHILFIDVIDIKFN